MSLDVTPASVPEGITRAQAMLSRQRPTPMEDTLGYALVEISDGRAVFAGTPGHHVLNPMGIAHGGYAARFGLRHCPTHALVRWTEVFNAGDQGRISQGNR